MKKEEEEKKKKKTRKRKRKKKEEEEEDTSVCLPYLSPFTMLCLYCFNTIQYKRTLSFMINEQNENLPLRSLKFHKKGQ